MGKIGEKLDIDFVVSTGDNFYERGLKNVSDPKYPQSFTQIYTAHSLQKQWYIGELTLKNYCFTWFQFSRWDFHSLSYKKISVLGNHDYRGNALAQLSPVLRKMDSRWLCLRSFLVNTQIADFFFIDTNPFVDKYWSNPKHYKHDWRGVIPRQRYLSNLLKVLLLLLLQFSNNINFTVKHLTKH